MKTLISSVFLASLMLLASCGDDNIVDTNQIDQFSNPATAFSNEFCGQIAYDYVLNSAGIHTGSGNYALQADQSNQIVTNILNQLRNTNQIINGCVYTNVNIVTTQFGWQPIPTIIVQHIDFN